jgi:SAM-dependent methyltransferase
MRALDEHREKITSSVSYPDNRDLRDAPWLQAIVDDVPPSSSVLDIGCGNGRVLAPLQSKGCKARGIDLAPPAVALARSKGLDVLVGNVDDPSPEVKAWLNQPYDVVLFCKSLGYLETRHDLISTLQPRSFYIHINRPGYRQSLRFLRLEPRSPLEIPWIDANGRVEREMKSVSALCKWGESFGYRSRRLYGAPWRRNLVLKFLRNACER